jgi:hypothetical protein
VAFFSEINTSTGVRNRIMINFGIEDKIKDDSVIAVHNPVITENYPCLNIINIDTGTAIHE